jgi:PAT family beta-lactamase induction signal transducer AmpG
VVSPHRGKPIGPAIKGVAGDLMRMVKTKGGLLAAILCFLPIGTGAAAGVLTQDPVAMYWGADAEVVALVQGLLAAGLTTAGCFVGGYACQRFRPQSAYAAFGVFLAVVAVGMAFGPHRPVDYIGWNLVYSFGVGLTYSSFTAVVLDSMGSGSGATKYNILASLANFPTWWLGLLLARVADKRSAPIMLLTEAALGVIAVLLFGGAILFVRESALPDREPILD